MENREIRISEIFGNTVQGEGVRTGHPAAFIRVFGCNLKCPGFGLGPGEPNTEIPSIIQSIDKYKVYHDLPLSKTGCDSYPSSWSQFKRFSEPYTYDRVIEKLRSIVGDDPHGLDLVITGGEPLLKPTQEKLVDIFEQYSDYINRFDSITFETNGTQTVNERLGTWLSLRCKIPVIFSISPKLECSGESADRRIVPAAIDSIRNCVKTIRNDNMLVHKRRSGELVDAVMYVKYVVTDRNDVINALENVKEIGFNRDEDGLVYLMPCGGTYEQYVENQKRVCELAIEYRCNFCIREHVVIFRNCWEK